MALNDSASGPVVLITGAGRGIGRACAAEAAARGWSAVLVSRTASELAETAALFAPDLVATLAGDVTDPATADRAVGLAQSRFGGTPLGAALYCAGVAPLLGIEQTTPEILRETIDTNLSGAYHFARSAWGPMKAGGGGAIVNISSLASRDPFTGFSAYAAAKAGVNLMTLALHREGAPVGIRVYSVAPGAVETQMFRKLMSPQEYPTEKTLSPVEVAAVVWQCVTGAMVHSSGETIFLSKS